MGIIESWIKAEIYRDNIERGVKSSVSSAIKEYSDMQEKKIGIKTSDKIKFTTILNLSYSKANELIDLIKTFYKNKGLKCHNDDNYIIDDSGLDEYSLMYKEERVGIFWNVKYKKRKKPSDALDNVLIFDEGENVLIVKIDKIKNKIQITFIFKLGEEIKYQSEAKFYSDILTAIENFFIEKLKKK